uniref:Lysine-specific demethylase 8 n=1 Tax=Schistocephalus solidus TaxID=70667 RepID=A0A0X3NJT1_SCHSO
MSVAIAIQALEDAGLSTDVIANEFLKLRGGYPDEIFLNECLHQLEGAGDTHTDPATFTILIEYTREKLNTGHWSEVPDCWRISYALLRLASAITRLRAVATENEAICQLKLALWELDDALIMGFCSLNEGITKMASFLNKLTNDPTEHLFPASYPELNPEAVDLEAFKFKGERISVLPRVHQPSPNEFMQILTRGVPVIITGAMKHWRALNPTSAHYWSPSYWSKCAGRRTVPVEVGSAYTDDKWGQRLITVDCFLERFILPNLEQNHQHSVGSKGYLAQHQIFLQIPELADDVDIPDYCYVGGPTDSESTTIDSNIWFGPAGTISPLHHDSDRSNVLCQVIGRKYVKLYTADQTDLVYPHGDAMLSNTSQVDVVDPRLDEFPRFANASGFHGCIESGEMLFIPPRCWHYLKSLSCSISLNFWWNVSQELIPAWSSSYSAPANRQINDKTVNCDDAVVFF